MTRVTANKNCVCPVEGCDKLKSPQYKTCWNHCKVGDTKKVTKYGYGINQSWIK